jgi:integrase
MFTSSSTRKLADAFLTAKRSAGRSPATLESYKYHLAHFAQLSPQLPTAPEPIEEFLASIPGQRYRWNHYVTLRTFYRWLRKRHGVPNPIPSVERPRLEEPLPVYLDEVELARLLLKGTDCERDQALIWLLADTGMRIGEAHSITPCSVRGNLVLVQGKARPRFVPMNPVVAEMIHGLIADTECPHDETIWRWRHGPLTVDGLKSVVRRAFRRAGFKGPKMSAHRLRHTFATLWEGSEMEGRLIGGWRSAEMWQRYHHLRLKRVVSEHRRFSPLIKAVLNGEGEDAAPQRPSIR